MVFMVPRLGTFKFMTLFTIEIIELMINVVTTVTVIKSIALLEEHRDSMRELNVSLTFYTSLYGLKLPALFIVSIP